MLEKYSYITFYVFPSSGSGIVTCGRTDRQTPTAMKNAVAISRTRQITAINLNYIDIGIVPRSEHALSEL